MALTYVVHGGCLAPDRVRLLAFPPFNNFFWPNFSTSAGAASLTPVRSGGHAPPRVSARGARAHAGAQRRPATPSGYAWNYTRATFLIFCFVLERMFRLANKNVKKDQLKLIIRKNVTCFYHIMHKNGCMEH